MLDAIKTLIERATKRAESDAIAGWARRAGYVHKREKDGDGFAVEGSFDGTPWRMEWGRPQRRYIEGRELRMRTVLGVSPDLQMLLMTRSLKERLASEAFTLATQSNQTALDDSVGEETRWLVVFPKVTLGESQIVRSCYALVAGHRHEGAAWLEGPLTHALERAAATWLSAQPPFLLMTLRGRLYLRLQLESADEDDVAAALALFGIAGAAARRVARTHSPADPHATTWSSSTAWQTLPSDPKEKRAP